MDKKIELMFKTKPMLMRKPVSMHKFNFPINNYEEIISELKKYKSQRFHENYLVNSLFNFHLTDDNHILLVKLKGQVNSQCISRVLGCELYYKLWLGKLSNSSYVCCYI